MKTCTKCKKTLPLKLFNRKGLKRSGQCCLCNRRYLKKHYNLNKAYYRKKSKITTHKKVLFIRSYKEAPCCDCKKVFPHYVMDFDHVRGKKKFNLSVAAHQYSYDSIKKEIAKCDVVCSNCHRERTWGYVTL